MAEPAKPAVIPTKQSVEAMGNPALRMLGLPRLRAKLPSRNWLIFLSVVGGWTGTLLYDRYHKKRSQRKWCLLVSPLAQESLASKTMARKITIFLAAPPGDSLRVAREHFHEYIKPILVAGAVDWEVIEGRREGEVRAGLAEKIRKLRRRRGETSEFPDDTEVTTDDAVAAVREVTNTHESSATKGDLIIGRHVWKEYIRGLHEGWLGPLGVAPDVSTSPPLASEATSATKSTGTDSSSDDDKSTQDKIKAEEEKKAADNSKKSKPIRTPYIYPSAYQQAALSTVIDSEFAPCTTLPLPHILGFLNTPKRMYRFLTRRHLAEETGEAVAALVLASQSSAYQSIPQLGETSKSGDVAMTDTGAGRSQQTELQIAEEEWHKCAWADSKEGEEREKVWTENAVVDPRIGNRMRYFTLPDGADAKATSLEQEDWEKQESYVSQIQRLLGLGPKPVRGWDMGLIGSADD